MDTHHLTNHGTRYDKQKESPAKGEEEQHNRGKGKAVKMLAGGNPQIAKADGDAPVQAYIDAMPGWKRDIGKRLDALIVRTLPGVRKAVKSTSTRTRSR